MVDGNFVFSYTCRYGIAVCVAIRAAKLVYPASTCTDDSNYIYSFHLSFVILNSCANKSIVCIEAGTSMLPIV